MVKVYFLFLTLNQGEKSFWSDLPCDIQCKLLDRTDSSTAKGSDYAPLLSPH